MQTIASHTITFGLAGNAAESQLFGWSGGENGFTWTLGTESGLTLLVPDAPFGYFIEMWVDPFLVHPDCASQRMRILSEGSLIGDVNLRRGGTFAFFVDASSRRGGARAFTIEHPDARSPEPGGRVLGLAFRRVRVLVLAEPVHQARYTGCAASAASFIPADETSEVCGMPIRDFILSFETLAGNCEFGNVQRAFGAEPLALFRFAGASISESITGLDTDFEGIGEDVRPYIANNGIKEWMIHDKRYSLNYHTMLSSNDISEDRIIVMEKRKIRFLLGKFLDDLKSAPKIFICADPGPVDESEVLALFLALRRRSDAWLLWVRPDKPSGTVEHVAPGFMRGSIDRLASPDNGTDVSSSGWLAVLASAWSLKCLEQTGGRYTGNALS